MDMFANLLEILAPSPAPKEPIQSPVIEVGNEISLRAINGELFNCFVLVPMKNAGSTLARCKYLLAVTDNQIVELYPHSTKLGVAVAAEVHELQALVKLKFKKGDQGILLLEYKNGKVSKLLMDDPAVCVGQIKNKMKNMGINGSIKNKTERIVENAQGFFKQAKDIETQFSLSPSVEYVQEMMDLLRKATEKFAEVNDDSYMDVMDFIKKFLQRPDVNKVLDASVKTPLKTPAPSQQQQQQTPVGTFPAEEITPSQIPASSSSSQYALLDLPDIDAELSSLRNALTYQFEEDDHPDHLDHPGALSPLRTASHLGTPASASGSAGKSSRTAVVEGEKCELSEMLDKMHLEFDSLLSSFGDSSTDLAGAGGGADSISGAGSEQVGLGEVEDSEDAVGGFLEVDFDQTLAEMVNL